nr:hypothetical protein [Tanacetum cinerariifolium]
MPVWRCDRLVSRAKIPIEVPVVPADLPVAPKVGAVVVASPISVLELDIHSSPESGPSKGSLPPVPVAPIVLPFLCSHNFESNTELPESHVSSATYVAMVARWRSRVALRPSSPSGSSSLTTSTLEISTALILPAPPTIDIPVDRLYATHPGGLCRALTASKMDGPLPSHHLALRRLHLPYHSAGPSCKRCRSKDSYSLEDSIEEDIDADVVADIKASAAAAEAATTMDVEAGIDASIGIKVGVGGKDEDEQEAESSDIEEQHEA